MSPQQRPHFLRTGPGLFLLLLACLSPGCARPKKVQARVARPSRGDLVGHFVASGRVKCHLVRVHTGYTGRLIDNEVKENQKVHKGQVLGTLNAQELTADLEVFQAELEAARNREIEAAHALSLRSSQLTGELRSAQAGQQEAEAQVRLTRRPLKHEMARARAAVEAAEARLKLAQSESLRSRQLFDQDILSAAQLERSETDHKAARAELEQAQAQLRMHEQQPRAEELEVAKAKLNQARAERLQAEDSHSKELQVYEDRLRVAIQETHRCQGRLKTAQLRLSRTEIKAPEDGVVLQLMYEPGEYVDWLQPFLTMVTSRGLRVEAEVDEQDATKVVLDMPVEVSFTSMPGQNFAGKVVQISPALERRTRGPSESRVLRIRVELKQPPALRDGLEAQVEGNLVLARDTLLLPRSAVFRDRGADSVMAVRSGQAVELKVQIGAATADRVELTGGVDSNTVVIVEGGDRITQGAGVDPLP
ncbi:efflux RND transporter periplasmic adaptor subunit [bacterium]|nr:efflux RND transporter periplasmic adaptor subunit [bacterium]